MGALVMGCGAPSREVVVSFRVETPTQTADGRDIDDASPTALLLVGGHTLRAGVVYGHCAPADGGICKANAPPGTVVSLACGGDPHVDRTACVYGVRSKGTLELWRQDFDVVIEDGAPPKVSGQPRTRIGGIAVDESARLTVGRPESRDVRR